jgi:hypothetical protein
MLQSATSNQDAHEAFRGFMRSYVLTAVGAMLGGDEQGRLRALLAATNLVALVAPSVHRYLTADAAELGFDSLSLQGVESLVEHE